MQLSLDKFRRTHWLSGYLSALVNGLSVVNVLLDGMQYTFKEREADEGGNELGSIEVSDVVHMIPSFAPQRVVIRYIRSHEFVGVQLLDPGSRDAVVVIGTDRRGEDRLFVNQFWPASLAVNRNARIANAASEEGDDGMPTGEEDE